MLRFGAVAVHPLVIRSVMVRTPQVVDYVARQTARGVAVSAQAPHDPEVSVDVVAELPRNHEPGKLHRFVPLR